MSRLRRPAGLFPAPDLQVIAGNASWSRQADPGIGHVKSQDGFSAWSFTKCLFPDFNHPEVLVAGLDPFLARSVLSRLVGLIARGRAFADGSSSDGVLHTLVCAFRQIPAAAAAKLMPSLGGRPALQLIYPDNRNKLPWQSGHHPSWREVQPLFIIGAPLGEVECRFLEAAMHRPHLAPCRKPQQPRPLEDCFSDCFSHSFSHFFSPAQPHDR